MHPAYVLIPAMLLSLALLKLNQHYASPLIGIVNRWLRWGVMAGGLALITKHFAWSERDFSTLLAAYLLVWLLLDSIYRWLAIHAMSVSPLPLFPRFGINQAGDEWPVQSRFLKLRDRVRAAGFKQQQSVRAEVATAFYVRATIYQEADNKTRLQVAFLPQPAGGVIASLSFSTQFTDGRRFVTDNHHLPFAGFYPETWHLERCPHTRSFDRLLSVHRQRVAASGGTIEPWSTDPLSDLNAQQIELERLNTEMGFLHPTNLHEEHGRISHEGRFRVWKEMLMLDYFGRPARYE
jgi:hypothetical protein